MRSAIVGLLGACTLIVAGNARAEQPAPVTYNFQVRITQQDVEGECPAKGKLMPLSITVDRAFPVTPPTKHTEHYHGGPGFDTRSPILSVSVNGQAPYEPGMDDVYVSKNYRGIYSYDFLGFDSGEGVTLVFSTSNSAAVPSYRIPPTIYPHNFTTATFTFTGKESYCQGNIVSR